MFKRFLKGLLTVIIVAALGFLSGYYSERFISPGGQPVAPGSSEPGGAGAEEASPGPGPVADTASSPAPAISEDDLSLGGLKPGDNRQRVEETLGQPIKVRKSVDRETGQNIRTFITDRLTVEWSKKTGVFAITATSPEVVTVRGLQVGDPMDKAYRLYGRPASEQGGLAAYQNPASGIEVFFIKYADNKITEIKIKK